jgi:cyclopropane-fatty-acyl-phospholipid synthase
MVPLSLLLRRLIRQGHLEIADAKGRTHHYGDIDAPVDAAIRLHSGGLPWRLARSPAYNIAQAYMDGLLTIEKGTLLDFLGLMLRNTAEINKAVAVRLAYRLQDMFGLPAVLNRIGRARRNVQHHYDLSGALFSLFLDSDRQYSCAYYRSADDDLEAAQLAKKQHIAAKLCIRPGQELLDIGSGWGGLALYLARHYPTLRVTGLTLSQEQLKHSRTRARQMGLSERVSFKLEDYRQHTGSYDRIVSVGMFEHVGRPHFGVYFDRVRDLLKPNGAALIHTIAYRTASGPINPWLRRNIFPGAYLPSLAQLAPILERRQLWITDLESLRLHYAYTLADWHRNFQRNRAEIAALYDERFCRMWEFYLQSCEAGFRWGALTVYQLQLAKAIDALPITRDYIGEEEARLREADAKLGEIPYAKPRPA